MSSFPAVALLGPRQAGKTTLAQVLADELADKAVYPCLSLCFSIALSLAAALRWHSTPGLRPGVVRASAISSGPLAKWDRS